MHHQHTRRVGRGRDGRKISDDVVRHLLEQRPDPETAALDQQSVAVGHRARHRLARYYSTAAVFDYDRLTDIGSQRLREQTRMEISIPADLGSDDAHGLLRIVLTACSPRTEHHQAGSEYRCN